MAKWFNRVRPVNGDGRDIDGTAPPITFTAVQVAPIALTPTWQKIVNTTAATRGLRLAPLGDATAFDIEWCVYPAGSSAPADTRGEPIGFGEDFRAGMPIGDIWCRSATSQFLLAKTGA